MFFISRTIQIVSSTLQLDTSSETTTKLKAITFSEVNQIHSWPVYIGQLISSNDCKLRLKVIPQNMQEVCLWLQNGNFCVSY